MNRVEPDSQAPQSRRLAAILFSDIVGYSSMTEKAEGEFHRALEKYRTLFRRILIKNSGREVRVMGDGFFVEFSSAVDAVQCAVEIQSQMSEWNATLPNGLRILTRIGIHLGDVLDLNGEAHGHEVNVSARLEALASPGGICVSEIVRDQVSGKADLHFDKVGKFKLKNMSKPIIVYRVAMPWERRMSAYAGLRLRLSQANVVWKTVTANRSSVTATILGLSVLASLFGFIAPIAKSLEITRYPDSFLAGTRGPAGRGASQSLAQNWKLAPNPRTEPGHWIDIDPNERESVRAEINGEYWMKTELELDVSYQEPTLVLGLVPERHRVYVNGIWVGGAERQNPVPVYSIDPKILKYGQANTILVKAISHENPRAGLTVVPRIGIRIGEFSEIFQATHQDLLVFHLLRTALLAAMSVLTLLSVIYFTFNPTSREFLYFAIFGVVSFLMYLYQSPLLSDSFNARYFGLLKALPLWLMAPVLASAHAAMRKNHSGETTHNISAILVGAAVSIWVLTGVNSSRLLQERLNLAYLATAVYSFGAGFRFLREKVGSKRFGDFSGRLIATYLIVNGLFALNSIRGMAAIQLPSELRSVFSQLLVFGPISFGAVIISSMLIERLRLSKKAADAEEQNGLSLRIAEIISSRGRTKDKVRQLHQAICMHLGVNRSTLYVAKSFDAEKLFAECIIAPPENVGRVAQELPLEDGIVGYAYRRRTPVLVQDIENDLRFRDLVRGRSGEESVAYPTGSCIVFPLLVSDQFVGLVTLTEKANGKMFEPDDFQKIQLLAPEIALLLANQLLETERAAAA
ncbi:MAG: GAF domain-containing protein [Bdellovibrionales bacterium]|nr:GAF domain-containing protein [Bdellovibrionales bacterium]